MIEFITLISLLCSQPSISHGEGFFTSRGLREETFLAQSSCTKRLFKACFKDGNTVFAEEVKCLVEKL